MIPTVNHVVLAGTVSSAPSASRTASGDLLSFTLLVGSDEVAIEIRDPMLASILFKSVSPGAGMFLTGSVAVGATGIVVAIEGGRGHDARVVAAQPAVLSAAGPTTVVAPARAAVQQGAVPSPAPGQQKEQPVTAVGQPAAQSQERPAAAAAPVSAPAAPPAAAPKFPPRPSVAGPGGFRPGGFQPGARAATPAATPAAVTPAVTAAPAKPSGLGALGALKSAAKSLEESEPELQNQTEEDAAASPPVSSAGTQATRALPTRGGRFSQPQRPAAPGQSGQQRTGDQQAVSRARVEDDPFDKISPEAEEIPF
jgi:hypothetical protein